MAAGHRECLRMNTLIPFIPIGCTSECDVTVLKGKFQRPPPLLVAKALTLFGVLGWLTKREERDTGRAAFVVID